MDKKILKHALLWEVLLILASVEACVWVLVWWLAWESGPWIRLALHAGMALLVAGPLVVWRARARGMHIDRAKVGVGGRWGGLLLPCGVLMVGLLVTGLAAWSSWRGVRTAAEAEFGHLTDRLVDSIEQRMATFERALYATRGTFVVSERVDRAEFRRYARSREDESGVQGMQGYGFIELVRGEELEAFAAAARADGAPWFEVPAAGDRPRLMIIKYFEPEDRNRHVLGTDFGAVEANRLAAEAAIESGRPTLAGRQADSGNGYGFILPVYREGAETAQASQRREAVTGFVYVPVMLHHALADLASQSNEQLDYRVYDAPAAVAEAVLFDTDPVVGVGKPGAKSGGRSFFSSQTIAVGGRPWTIDTRSTDAFEGRISFALPGGIAVAGCIISGLMASVVFTLRRLRSRAAALAEGMTAELRASEQSANEAKASVERAMAELTAFQAAMDEHAIIAVTDLSGTIVHVNDLFCKISGYSRQELIGANHRLVNSGTHPRTFWTEMYRTVSQGKVWHAEVCNRAKDGSLYWVDTTVAPIRSASGRLDRFVAIRADLTERKRAEQRLIASEQQARDLALIAEKTNNAAVITDPQGQIVWVNEAFTRITEYSLEEVRGKRTGSFLQGPKTDPATIERIHAAISAGHPFIEEIYNYSKSGREYWLRIDATPVFDGTGALTHFIAVETDIHERKMSELLRAGQARVLELAAGRAPLAEVLAEVCSVVEEQCTGAAAGASVMLLEGGRLRSTPGGRLPAEFRQQIDGVEVGPAVGSCGAAAYFGRAWITADMNVDTNWAVYLELTRRFGLRACWSVPIPASSGETLGAVALYHSTPSAPTENDLRLLREVARLAALAIEQRRTEERMQEVMADVIRARDESERRGLELAERATELELLRDRAEQATAAKSAFLANMSHEIRTPLTAILGYADLLHDDGDLSSAPHRRLQTIDTIRTAGQHLLTVINDILDLSKIEADKMTVEHVEAELPAILHEVESLMRPRTGEKGVRLATHLETPIPERIISDPTRLRQILMNLVGNAVKFTDHGNVTVSAKVVPGESGERLLVDVIDTGSGLSSEQVERLFSPFSQADESVTRKHGGTGLGLTICRRLASLMGGSVTLVRSERGVGSCFRVDLPLVPVAGVRHVLSVSAVQPGDPAGAAVAAVTRLSGRILLAEDGADNQRLIAFHLRKAGAMVDVAENGLVALRMIQAAEADGNPYGLLLSDMQMPEMDGYTLARTLRLRGSRLAVVALTAHAMADDRIRCREAGCDDYATKPIDRATLLATCARWMGTRGGVAATLASI